MDDEIKEFISDNERKHKKYLQLYRIACMVEMFGNNGILLFECSSKIELFIHILVILEFPFFGYGKVGFLKGLIIYICLHLIIKAIGGYFIKIFKGKLDMIQQTCQDKLDDFCYRQYQDKKIIKGNDYDEVRFDHNLIVRNGIFEADLQVDCEPVSIYCLGNKEAKEQYKNEREKYNYDENRYEYIEMKKNIASTEFNQKFGVLVQPDKVHECMKFLSPSRQLQMIHMTAFDKIREIYISAGKICADTTSCFERPGMKIDVYVSKSIQKSFQEVEEYCCNIRKMADEFHNSYFQICELVNNQ